MVVAVLFVYLCHAAISAVGGTRGSTPAQIKEQIEQISLITTLVYTLIVVTGGVAALPLH